MSSSAARALRVLDEIAASDRPVGVTEIARALSLPAGTVFRSLDALARAGLVARYRASSRYVPGPMAERLHRSVIARFPTREICLPYLRQLASISGETVSLHVPAGWYAVRICSVPGTGEVMTSRPLGEAQPLHESPAGQVILAGLRKVELAAYRKWVSTLPLREGRFGVARERGAGSGRGVESLAAENRQTAIPSPNLVALTRSKIRPSLKGRVGPDAITAFAVRVDGRAIAAITIDGPLSNADQLSECQQVVANIETLALAQPGLFTGPFSHLAPQEIKL